MLVKLFSSLMYSQGFLILFPLNPPLPSLGMLALHILYFCLRSAGLPNLSERVELPCWYSFHTVSLSKGFKALLVVSVDSLLPSKTSALNSRVLNTLSFYRSGLAITVV